MIHILLLLALVSGGAMPADELHYTASTPANNEVRDFLGINRNDSIDFIRWKLDVVDMKAFELICTYGISKPNTNGFINEQKVEWKGIAAYDNGILTLSRQGKNLSLLLLNQNIGHLLDVTGNMMVGNGSWSYTLNALHPLVVTEYNFKAAKLTFTDSVVFDGRTPCRGMEELTDNITRAECYKKKWRVTLYKDKPGAVSGTYKIGTVAARTGTWKLKENSTGRPVYSLDLNNGNTLELLQVDKNILYIMDKKGGIMVGDHDFSYSLNRKM